MNIDFRNRTPHPILGQGIRMAVLTGISFMLGLALTSLLVEMGGLSAQAAFAIAVVLCTVVNFFGCRYWVFRTAHMPLWPEARRFFASVMLFRAAEVGVFHVVYVSMEDYRIAYVATQVTSLIAKFAIAKWFVFRDMGSNDADKPPH